jgi:nucleoside-diphosphate-sugar epimerase
MLPLLADENLHGDIIRGLRRRRPGIDLVRAQDVGLYGAGDPAVLVASSKKAFEVLGWKPKYADIHDIISSAWRWHTAHPEGYAETSHP